MIDDFMNDEDDGVRSNGFKISSIAVQMILRFCSIYNT